MKLSPSLVALLAFPVSVAALASLPACGGSDSDDKPKTEQTPVPANACAITDVGKDDYRKLEACTSANVAAHKDKSDGWSCYYSTCGLPGTKQCPSGYAPVVVSKAPSNAQCVLTNPVEL